MKTVQVFVDGIGLCGPGLPDWPMARAVLDGQAPYAPAPTVLPAPVSLPPAERRRVGAAIKLSMAIGLEAARHAQADPAGLPTVFSSSGGDCDNCHALCETLASDDRQVSPTRFHNSVHNAPSGYWSIATGCMATSTSLCAYDGTFGAALLEATAQVATSQRPCLLIAYDTAYPEPLHHLRPIPDAFGAALVLSPARQPHSLAALGISLGGVLPANMENEALDKLRASVPAARSLPLLRALARGESCRLVIDYLDDLALTLELSA